MRQRRLDDSLLRLADGILLRSIVATTAGAAATAVGSTAIATMPMPVIDIVAQGDDSGDDRTGDASVTTTTTNDYHTYNDETTRIQYNIY